jgi:hypothetical protein
MGLPQALSGNSQYIQNLSEINQCFCPVSSFTLSVKKLMLKMVCRVVRLGASKSSSRPVDTYAHKCRRQECKGDHSDRLHRCTIAPCCAARNCRQSADLDRLSSISLHDDVVPLPNVRCRLRSDCWPTRLISFESLSLRDCARRPRFCNSPSQKTIWLWGQLGLTDVAVAPGHPHILVRRSPNNVVTVSTATATISQAWMM